MDMYPAEAEMKKGIRQLYPRGSTLNVFLSSLNRNSRHLYDFCRRLGVFRPWINQTKEISNYLNIYGGLWAIFTSPYTHVAIIFGCIAKLLACPSAGFGQIGISILPNLLGFTIGG